MRPQIISGSRVALFLNGHRFGRAISLEMSSDTSTHPIETIDDLLPAEIAPTRTRVRGTVRCYRLSGDGGIEGAGVTTQFANIPLQKYFSLTLKDLGTDRTIFQFDFCMVEQQSWAVVTKDLMSGQFSFTGMTWGNETAANGSPF